MAPASRRSFRGKVVLVTGSSSGIGQSIAIEFAEAGANVVITGRNIEGLETTRRACLAAGLKEAEVLSVSGDLGNETFRVELVEKTRKTFGKLDVLINNAACYFPTVLVESTNSEFMDNYNQIFHLNVTAVVDLTKKCLDDIIATKGNVIVISSVAGTKTGPVGLPYSMSKAAVDMFTKGLALELGSKGVRANCILPGCIETKMLDGARVSLSNALNSSPDEVDDKFRNSSVLGRIGTPKDMSSLAVFLASDDAKFITGSLFVADGGYLLK